MRKHKNSKNIAYVVTVLFLALVLVYSGLQILESTVFMEEPEQEPVISTKTVTKNGVDYFPRQDITVWLIMGIDQSGPVKESNAYNNDGEADVVLLAIFEEDAEAISVLCLNRDTMLKMPVLGLGGKPAGTLYGQLALAHTFGSGLEDSCENVRRAVSDFFGGITIDYYAAMNMDAIGVLNDAVGGVTVTVTDDFSETTPVIGIGEVTLHADQALAFIRTRKDLGDQLNLSRMERHKEYMRGFLEAYRAKGDLSATAVYEDVSAYTVTDCSLNTLGTMMDRFANYTIKEIVSPEGENILGEAYYEFYADEEKLENLVLRLFYAPKN